ncbi:MAG: DUF6804 family protein [bacterium]
MLKKENKYKNIVTIILVIFLFLAIIEGWPYGFFTLFRLVVCGATGYLAYLAFKSELPIWAWIFVLIVFLFNPIMPVHLDKDLWMGIDLLVVFLLIISLFAFKPHQEHK